MLLLDLKLKWRVSCVVLHIFSTRTCRPAQFGLYFPFSEKSRSKLTSKFLLFSSLVLLVGYVTHDNKFPFYLVSWDKLNLQQMVLEICTLLT